MASIYSKRKVLYLGWYEELLTGKRVHRSISLKLKDTRENRKLANLIKKQKEHSLLFTKHELPIEIKIKDAYEKFIETKERKAKKTKEYYEQSNKKLKEEYGEVKVYKITEKEIEKIEKEYRKQKMSEESIITYKKGMKVFFNYLIEKKYINKNPVGRIEKIRNRKVEVMSDKELEDIVFYFKSRNKDHYDLVKFLALSGFRISEAVSLKWEDIKEDYIIVNNVKGKRKDYFPLLDTISEHLETIEKTGEKVFRYKEVSSARYLNKMISAKTKKKYSFHSFRKKFGTDWARKLMPAELKEIMRHKDIGTTIEHYVGLNIINIGDKMTVAKRKLKEKNTDENCQIIDIKTGEIRQKRA